MARPLPSQRAGSYQGTGQAGAGGAGSAQDRLKQRLWGAGRQSPGQAGGQFQPPGNGGNDDKFAPGGPYSQDGRGRGRMGLPSGPRGYR